MPSPLSGPAPQEVPPGPKIPQLAPASTISEVGGTSISADDPDDPDQTDQCINFVKPGMEISRIDLGLLGRAPDEDPLNGQPLRYMFLAGNLTADGKAFFNQTLAAPEPAPVPRLAGIWALFAALVSLWPLRTRCLADRATQATTLH